RRRRRTGAARSGHEHGEHEELAHDHRAFGGMTSTVAWSGVMYCLTTRCTSAVETFSISSPSRRNEPGLPLTIHDRPIASARPCALSSENTKLDCSWFLARRSSSPVGPF